LPYTGAEIAERLFHQEKATFENAEKCTGIVKPSSSRAIRDAPILPRLTCVAPL